jgi:hypothetical protein
MMARGKPWTNGELEILQQMAAQGLNPQQIYDNGKTSRKNSFSHYEATATLLYCPDKAHGNCPDY